MSGPLISGQAAVTITLGGQQYQLRRATVAVIHAAEAEVLTTRTNPLAEAAKVAASLPAEQAKLVWELAFDRLANAKPVTVEELTAWLESVPGVSWFIWYMIQDDPQAPSRQEVARLVTQLDLGELQALAASVMASLGTNDLKNSSGRRANQAQPATPPVAGEAATAP